MERQGEKETLQESWQNEWRDIEYQGEMAKAPPCPERTLKTPLPQQSSSSSRDEESQWVAMEDRRRRSIAFEKVAKIMLKYLEDSEDLKVGVTELQQRLGISEKVCTSIRQNAPPASDERKRPKDFRHFSARRRRGMYCQSRQGERAAERSGGVGKRCQNMMQEVTLLSERQDMFKSMMEDKRWLQSRATDKYRDQIF